MSALDAVRRLIGRGRVGGMCLGGPDMPREVPYVPPTEPEPETPLESRAAVDGPLEGILARNIALVDRLPDDDRRAWKGRLHVSSAMDMCPRDFVLGNRQPPGLGQCPTSSDRVMWATGRAIEAHVRAALIRRLGAENIWGDWGCCRCMDVHPHQLGGMEICDGCEMSMNYPRLGISPAYREPLLTDADDTLEGHPDIVILVGGELVVVEVKSITDSDAANSGGRGFTAMKNSGVPQAAHMVQSGCYREMLAATPDLPFPVSQSVLVLYVRKEYRFASPYCQLEFRPRDHPAVMHSIREVFDTAARVKAVMDGGAELPGRLPACQSPTSPRSAKCASCATCYSEPI